MSSVIAVLAHVHIKVAGPWASIAVASLALVFTIGSFWWLNARQGRLKSFEPQSFAACRTPDILRLRFPLVFYNTGAKPIVVQDMRLSFPLSPRPAGLSAGDRFAPVVPFTGAARYVRLSRGRAPSRITAGQR